MKSPNNPKLENMESSKLQRVQKRVSKSDWQELGGLYIKAIGRSGYSGG